MEPSLARELALTKRFREMCNSFSDDDDFSIKKVNKDPPSRKGKGIGKGKSNAAAPSSPPPPATPPQHPPTTTKTSTRSKGGPSTAAPTTTTAPATTSTTKDDNSHNYLPPFQDVDNLPVDAQCQVTHADRGARECEARLNELTGKLKKRGQTVSEEQEIMDEIKLQTEQLEV